MNMDIIYEWIVYIVLIFGFIAVNVAWSDE